MFLYYKVKCIYYVLIGNKGYTIQQPLDIHSYVDIYMSCIPNQPGNWS
jgi:hypothetical protein